MTYALWSAWPFIASMGASTVFLVMMLFGTLVPGNRVRDLETAVDAQKESLKTLLSQPPPFALRSNVSALKACSHDNKVDVEGVFCQKVAEWCPDCNQTLYWSPWISGTSSYYLNGE